MFSRPIESALPPLLLLILTSALAAAPVARLDSEPVHPFGQTEKTKPVEHAFAVSNPGDAPLKLVVGPHCECTTITLKPAEIPPAGRGEVLLSMDPSELWGTVRKQALITTNDPQRPELMLSMIGSVVSDLKAEPSQLYFGTVDQKDIVGLERAIVIYSPSRAIGVQKIQTPPELEARTEPLSRTKGFVLWLKFKSKPPVGAYQQAVVVLSDHAESPTRIPFSGIVQGRVSLQPPTLAFQPDESATKVLKIFWTGAKPLTVKSAVTRFEGLTVDLRRASGEQAYIVEARFAKGQAKQRAGVIEIQTDDEDNKVLRVPVLIMGAPAKP